jgi:hypothetical protein
MAQLDIHSISQLQSPLQLLTFPFPKYSESQMGKSVNGFVMAQPAAQPAAHQEGAQPLVPQAPKPPIVYRRRIHTRR